MEAIGQHNKKKAFSVRLAPDIRMRLEEIASVMGADISTVVKAGVMRLLDEIYDSDGNIVNREAIRSRRKMPLSKGYYPVADIAGTGGVNVEAVRTWIRRGQVSHCKINGRVYVLLKDVESMLYGKENKHREEGGLRD